MTALYSIGPPDGGGWRGATLRWRVNTADIVTILAPVLFEQGQYAALKPEGAGDGQVLVTYDAADGHVSVHAAQPITSIQLDSASGVFTGDPAANLGGPFDVDADAKVFKATFGSSLSDVDLGTVAPAGLEQGFLLADLTASGSYDAGGTFGSEVELRYIPEPSTLCLLVLGLLGFVTPGIRRLDK